MTNKKAIIVGCGIAGPILALSLHRSGIDSTIYEAQKKHSDNMGLMIYLNPSGCNILETFGLYDKVKRVSVICNKIKINSHDGKNIVNFDQSNHKEVFGVHTLAIKRGDLNKILREEVELKGIKIERGKRLTNIENTETRSTIAFFEDGTSVRGDFVVGCDGINSKVRQIIMPDALPPKFTGSYVIGGMTDTIPANTKPKNTICFNLGKKSVFIYHLTSMGQAVWGCDMQISKESIKEKINLSNDEWKKIIMSRHKDDDVFLEN